jgi:hypothetical protein
MSATPRHLMPTDLEHFLAIGIFNELAEQGVSLNDATRATRNTVEWMRRHHPALLPVSENEPHNWKSRN